MSVEVKLPNRIELTPRDRLQAESKGWWEANPMSYDWHRTLQASEGTREFYDEIDRRFFASSSFYRGERPFEKWIHLDRLRGKRVLEIGCGLGTHAQLLAASGCHLTCIDLTEKAVENTRRRLELRGLSADIRLMDAEEMDFPDREFDLVWSWGVIHHSSDTERIIQQVFRVLKPGAEFRLMVYHRRSLSGLYSLGRGILTGKFFKGMSTHEVLSFYTDGYLARFYTRQELQALLVRCGFSQIETQVLGQKSELLPLPGTGASGRLKRALLRGIPDGLAERVLSMAGYFLFAVGRKNVPGVLST
ncbi:MAG TPA: class I SAM-dependent methyltransferase [Candidatus Acidoferrales bacterium]|nr:class I SAM-dependent methyltransferase [Candidatus Acidoferrales bacterium]